MSSRPPSALRAVLQSPEFLVQENLVASGRAKDLSATDTEQARETRAERSSGDVLRKIEAASQRQQQLWNERIDAQIAALSEDLKRAREALQKLPKGPEHEPQRTLAEESIARLEAKRDTLKSHKVQLTHAVQGHGKGTDQRGRVLHGRRADEPAVIDPTTVGQHPSNVSGAFTTHQGMLGVFNEAFAQADLVTHHAELQRRGGTADTSAPQIDGVRFTTTVETGESLGYNLEVPGVPKQTPGRALTREEIEHREHLIRKNSDLPNATVVMDPGLLVDDKGQLILDAKGEPKQMGWNVQTAFAHGRAAPPESQYLHVGEVANASHDQEHELAVRATRIAEARAKEKVLKAKLELERADLIRLRRREADDLRAQDEAQRAQEQAQQGASALHDKLSARDKEFDSLQKVDKDATSVVRQLLVLSKLPPADLATHKAEVAKLKSKVAELREKCEDDSGGTLGLFDQEGDEGSGGGGVRSGLETQAELLDQAQQLVDFLQSVLDASRLLENARLRAEEDTRAAKEEAERLQKSPVVLETLAAMKAEQSVIDANAPRARELREKVARRDEAHTAEHGLAEAPDAVEGYDVATGQYTGDRPDKLPILRGVDEDFDPLTAHHLYPWNKIKADLNKALAARSESAMKALFQFADFEPHKDFWTELAKEPALRSYAFAADVNLAAQALCWSPRNIFMGPLGEKRGDDPGEELDETFEKDNRKLQTLDTRIAHAMEAQGGISPCLGDDEVAADLPAILLARKLRALQRKLEPGEEEKLRAQAELEASRPEVLEKAIAERKQAAQDVDRLLKERDDLHLERQAALKLAVHNFAVEHASDLSRLSPEDVRADLEVRQKDGDPPLQRSAIDAEVARRQALARRLDRLRDRLAHAPKAYDPDEWQVDKDGKKVQRKT